MAKPIGTLGAVPTLQIGGRIFTDLDNLLVLNALVSSNDNCTFRLPNGSAGYQVTNTKTLTIKAMKTTTIPDLGGTRFALLLAQSDNDVGFDSATSLTNAIYESGSGVRFPYIIDDVTQVYVETDANFAVASQKYLTTVKSSALTAMAVAYGYET